MRLQLALIQGKPTVGILNLLGHCKNLQTKQIQHLYGTALGFLLAPIVLAQTLIPLVVH